VSFYVEAAKKLPSYNRGKKRKKFLMARAFGLPVKDGGRAAVMCQFGEKEFSFGKYAINYTFIKLSICYKAKCGVKKTILSCNAVEFFTTKELVCNQMQRSLIAMHA